MRLRSLRSRLSQPIITTRVGDSIVRNDTRRPMTVRDVRRVHTITPIEMAFVRNHATRRSTTNDVVLGGEMGPGLDFGQSVMLNGVLRV